MAMPKLKSVEPSKWYLVVRCAGCGEAILFAKAPSPKEAPDPLRYPKIAGLKCGLCGHIDTYAPELMSRQRHEGDIRSPIRES
jgi:hypothetical protein